MFTQLLPGNGLVKSVAVYKAGRVPGPNYFLALIFDIFPSFFNFDFLQKSQMGQMPGFLPPLPSYTNI
jgi:hypothetical protein